MPFLKVKQKEETKFPPRRREDAKKGIHFSVVQKSFLPYLKLSRNVLSLGLALWVAQAFLPNLLRAQEDDPGLIRALQTDSASVDNTYYLFASFDNDTSNYHDIYMYGEGVIALGKDWGVEIDFPVLYDWDPLGRYPVGLGPIGLNIRYEAYHFGGWSSETAGIFSIEAGAAYGTPNDTYRYIGSSWMLEALGGYRVGKLFLEGNYCWQGGIDPQVSSQVEANTSLGYSLGSNWYIQGEADFTAITTLPTSSSWVFIPQIAFQPEEWLFEVGEALNETPAGVTEILVARTF